MITKAGRPLSEPEDVRLFVEPNNKFLDVLIRIGKEMQRTDVGKRQFRLVDSVDDEPDLVITLENDLVQFHIMDETCRQYGLTRMPFEIDVDPDYICGILRSAADFYWHLHHSNKEGKIAWSRKITFECVRLVQSGEFTDDFEEVMIPEPGGHNLNVGGTIIINTEEDAVYGYKITNNSNTPLYAALFYFDISDLSIGMWISYQPAACHNRHFPRFVLFTGYGRPRNSRSFPPG